MWLADRLCMMAARTQGLITDFLVLFFIRWALKGLGVGYVNVYDTALSQYLAVQHEGTFGTVFYGAMYFVCGLPELLFAAMWAVYAVVMLAVWGQTLGTVFVGVRLVDRFGKRPALWRVVLRQIVTPLSSILWVGFLIAWVAPGAATLHDLIAGTRPDYVKLREQQATNSSG